MTEGEKAAPSVLTSPVAQSTDLIKDVSSSWLSYAAFEETSEQLKHAEKRVQILLSAVRIVSEL